MKKNKAFREKIQIFTRRKSRFSVTEIRFKKAIKEAIFGTLRQCWKNWTPPGNIQKGKDEEGWIVLAGELNWNY